MKHGAVVLNAIADAVRHNVDVIVTNATSAALAAKSATTTIPIDVSSMCAGQS
jgi:ABC-type uncharacterized transport system substrate-binding protein